MMPIQKEHIKKAAINSGFDACGIARADHLVEEETHLREFLARQFHGSMAYMENHFEKRCDPTKLVDGAKSVIVMLHNYFPPKQIREENNYKLARYAYGEDYHHVLKEKMRHLVAQLAMEFGEFNYRCFTDSAPVLERAWAVKAGLGQIGKNGNLIVPGKGSWFFIAEIICDLEIEPDEAFSRDLCGKCTRCMDACPTQAIIAPRKLDARKCLSYLTIEHRDEIPEAFKNKTGGFIFGCDICQEVCPHNSKAQPHAEEKFLPPGKLYAMDQEKWKDLSADDFRKLFKKSAVKRTKYPGLMRNIRFQAKD